MSTAEVAPIPEQDVAGGNCSPGGEEGSLSEGENEWQLEYDDWQGERTDFTKKLNAARSLHVGASSGQQRNDYTPINKSFQVSFS